MKIDLRWEKPIRLKDEARLKGIYSCRLDRVPAKPGVYIFARTFGNRVVPLYVGQALRLRSRIDGQFNNLRLMLGLKQSDNGGRILLVGRLNLHPGQQKKKVLDIVESALIKHALAGGHDLLNKQGKKTKVHVIKSEGNQWSRKAVPLKILVERKKGA